MKVLGISCGRKNGNSEFLLKQSLKAVEDAGHEVSYLRLQDYYIKPCTGCELCSNPANYPDGVFVPRCIHKWEDDHLKYILDQVAACDGLIISAPAYHTTVPGILISFLNRIHCYGFARHTEFAASQKRIVATIGVGGSDMTNLFTPLINFIGTELCGSQMNLVDQMMVSFCAPPRYVTLLPEAFQRAELLGKHVAEGLAELSAGEALTYRGDKQETCPVCHSDLLQLDGDRVRCPICNILGDLKIEDGKIKVSFDGGVESSRFTDNENEDAVAIRQRDPYKQVRERKDEVAEASKRWTQYLSPLPVPELN